MEEKSVAPKLIRTGAAAKILGVSRKVLLRLAVEGDVEYNRIGKQFWFNENKVLTAKKKLNF